MKDSGTMNGGSFQSTYIDTYARYLLRCLQGFQSKGITAYAIGIQVSTLQTLYSHIRCSYLGLFRMNLRLGLFPVNSSTLVTTNGAQNSNPTYPTAKFTYTQEGQVATTLRTLMNANGFGGTVIVGFEHNWDGATSYASNLVSDLSLLLNKEVWFELPLPLDKFIRLRCVSSSILIS
jgi:hypothetical protein